jgi:hypothetical protein
MNGLQEKRVLLSATEFDNTGAETVHAVISNDWAKDAAGLPLFGKEYSYVMEGYQLHAPIPKDKRGGFASFEDAEKAARQEYQDWRSGKSPGDVKVTRQESWEMKYRQNRYLSHLTNDELAERLDDVTNNLMTLTRNQKIGFLGDEDEGDYWSASYAHLMEECRLRQTGVPVGRVKEWHHPNYDWPSADDALELFNRMKLVPGSYLVKYMTRDFAEAALNRGEIRVWPASDYDDSSLNFAVRDDELSLLIRPQPKAGVLSGATSASTGEILRCPTNYYVYCMASVFSLRLFGDFERDACLIITDPKVFIERLVTAVMTNLPSWNGFGSGVHYVDPVRASKDDINLFNAKSFRYAYQQEYRLVWLPPSPQTHLAPIDVVLGSLNDCCELISLK